MGQSLSWIKKTVKAAKPKFIWQSSVRVSVTIGGPFFVGAATGYLAEAMWVAYAVMFFSASEKPGILYQSNIRKTVFVLPFSMLAFMTGYLSDLLTWAQFVLLIVVAFFAGAAATWNQMFATVAMQVMMITSIVTGMTDKPYWIFALCFALGAGIYMLGLALQGVATQKENEKTLLDAAISALSVSCRERAALEPAARETYSGMSAFAGAFSKAALPDLMDGRYRVVMDNLDRVAAECQAVSSRGELIIVADNLDKITRGERPSLTADVALEKLADSYVQYVSSNEHSNREDVFPTTRAIETTSGKYWTSFSVTSGIRLSFCFGVALLVGFLLPIDHLFWVATTVAMVMTPNMSAVVSRAVQRILGAFVGVILATAILWIDNSSFWLAFWISVMGFALPWIGSASTIYKQFFMVPIVLFFGDIIIPGYHSPQFYGPERLIATALGAVIIYIFGYLIWPKVRIPEFSAYYSPLGNALTEYLSLGKQPGSTVESTMECRQTVYRQLASFIQKVRVSAAEPPPTSIGAQEWVPVALAAGRLCDAITIEVDKAPNDAYAREEVERFERQLQKRIDNAKMLYS